MIIQYKMCIVEYISLQIKFLWQVRIINLHTIKLSWILSCVVRQEKEDAVRRAEEYLAKAAREAQ